MLLLLGVGLALFSAYEAFLTEDVLIMRAVELPPVLSKSIMILALMVALGLVVVSIGNLKNRKSKYLTIENGNLIIPKRFSKSPTVITLTEIENIERQDHDGNEMLIIKIANKLTNTTLESTKFESSSDYTAFLSSIEREIT